MKTITKRINTIFLFLLINLISLAISAQSAYKLSDLQGKKWILQGLNNHINEESYDSEKLTINLDNKYTVRFEYYLSDSNEVIFDSSKVGKAIEGRYIIERPLRAHGKTEPPLTVTIFEIIELTQNKLVLKNSKQQLLEYLAK